MSQAGRIDLHLHIRVDFSDPAGRHDCFVDAQIEYRGRHAVQIRQFDAVEVGQAQQPAQAFHGQRVCDGMSGAQADHADGESAHFLLFGCGDLVPVAIQSQSVKGVGPQDCHQRPPPRIVRPPERLGQFQLARPRQNLIPLSQ